MNDSLFLLALDVLNIMFCCMLNVHYHHAGCMPCLMLQGFLNWTHVPSNETFKKIHVPEDKIYQFAISANTKNASSGMIWASCTVIHNKGK